MLLSEVIKDINEFKAILRILKSFFLKIQGHIRDNLIFFQNSRTFQGHYEYFQIQGHLIFFKDISRMWSPCIYIYIWVTN